MSAVLPRIRIDPVDYLAWEALQAERHELVDGELFAMTGTRDAHNRVALNIAAAFKTALRGTPCRTFMSDMKLRLAHADAYVYPDVFVTCDERDRGAAADLAKQHPLLVVEVLSPGTAAYDRGRKFELLRGLASLDEVLFVEPERRSIDRFSREPGGHWLLRPAAASDVIVFERLGITLSLDAVYEDVEVAGSVAASAAQVPVA